jgi:hypothetical protein
VCVCVSAWWWWWDEEGGGGDAAAVTDGLRRRGQRRVPLSVCQAGAGATRARGQGVPSSGNTAKGREWKVTRLHAADFEAQGCLRGGPILLPAPKIANAIDLA